MAVVIHALLVTLHIDHPDGFITNDDRNTQIRLGHQVITGFIRVKEGALTGDIFKATQYHWLL